MTQITHTDALFNWERLHEEDLEPLSYYNLEEDYGNDNCISPLTLPIVHQEKTPYTTQFFPQGNIEDRNIPNRLLPQPPEFPTPLPLPDVLDHSSTTRDLSGLRYDQNNVIPLLPCPNVNITDVVPKKQKATRNRDKRNLKNRIDINGVSYKISYRESLLNQLHISFEDIVHAVKVKLDVMRGILPSPDETRVVCDRIKHEVFLHDCINVCNPSTRPYIHVHVNKTCTECIKKNSSRSKVAKI